MIITNHMQKIIQIYLCLLKLSRKQESVTDGQTDGRYYYIPSPLLRGDNKMENVSEGHTCSCFQLFFDKLRSIIPERKKWQSPKLTLAFLLWLLTLSIDFKLFV